MRNKTAIRRRSVTIYCPDTHLLYDAKTPDPWALGEGYRRFRLAQALAATGDKVAVVANVPGTHTYRGVLDKPLSEVRGIDSDILILNTSGEALDFGPVSELEIRASLIRKTGSS